MKATETGYYNVVVTTGTSVYQNVQLIQQGQEVEGEIFFICTDLPE